MDADPDTNWQLQVVKDLFPGAGNQAFYQSQRNGLEGGVPCPDFVQCGRREGSDCPGDGAGNPAPCNNDRLSRDGFFQFSTADGTPRPAVVGDVLKVGFDVRIHDGFAAFALTNDVAAMAAETGDTSIHPPLTKWNVGFGQTFNAEGMGLPTTSGGPCGGRDPHRKWHRTSHSNPVTTGSISTPGHRIAIDSS